MVSGSDDTSRDFPVRAFGVALARDRRLVLGRRTLFRALAETVVLRSHRRAWSGYRRRPPQSTIHDRAASVRGAQPVAAGLPHGHGGGHKSRAAALLRHGTRARHADRYWARAGWAHARETRAYPRSAPSQHVDLDALRALG